MFTKQKYNPYSTYDFIFTNIKLPIQTHLTFLIFAFCQVVIFTKTGYFCIYEVLCVYYIYISYPRLLTKPERIIVMKYPRTSHLPE